MIIVPLLILLNKHMQSQAATSILHFIIKKIQNKLFRYTHCPNKQAFEWIAESLCLHHKMTFAVDPWKQYPHRNGSLLQLPVITQEDTHKSTEHMPANHIITR